MKLTLVYWNILGITCTLDVGSESVAAKAIEAGTHKPIPLKWVSSAEYEKGTPRMTVLQNIQTVISLKVNQKELISGVGIPPLTKVSHYLGQNWTASALLKPNIPISHNLSMPRITLLVGSKVTNLIQASTVKFYTTGTPDPFATVGAGDVVKLQNICVLDYVVVSNAPASDNSLNRRWDVPGTQDMTVDADGELSIGKKVDTDGNKTADWNIKP
ncbi:hypothetical protein B0H34DRAFT_671722 [Crassisporium funariophilum]|nr:hypothetical protein B0H34DRAFT_671722 [Crassisporium funariophilum]